MAELIQAISQPCLAKLSSRCRVRRGRANASLSKCVPYCAVLSLHGRVSARMSTSPQLRALREIISTSLPQKVCQPEPWTNLNLGLLSDLARCPSMALLIANKDSNKQKGGGKGTVGVDSARSLARASGILSCRQLDEMFKCGTSHLGPCAGSENRKNKRAPI